MSAAVAPVIESLEAKPGMDQYVDVHCHIVHEKFEGEEDAVATRARAKGLEFCVVNGLEPVSNRAVLELCDRHPGALLPALGESMEVESALCRGGLHRGKPHMVCIRL